MNVPTNTMLASLMTDVTQAASGVAGVLNGAKVKPYVAPHAPLPTSVVADFTVSIDTGLAGSSVTWGAAHTLLNNGVAIDGNAHLWQIADTANACSIYGFLVTDSAGTALLYAEALDTPISLQTLLDGGVYVPQFAAGGKNSGSGSVVP